MTDGWGGKPEPRPKSTQLNTCQALITLEDRKGEQSLKRLLLPPRSQYDVMGLWANPEPCWAIVSLGTIQSFWVLPLTPAKAGTILVSKLLMFSNYFVILEHVNRCREIHGNILWKYRICSFSSWISLAELWIWPILWFALICFMPWKRYSALAKPLKNWVSLSSQATVPI